MQNKQPILTEQQQEIYFLDTLPLIRLFAAAKLRGFYRDYAEDLAQSVALNLWRWRMKEVGADNIIPIEETNCSTSQDEADRRDATNGTDGAIESIESASAKVNNELPAKNSMSKNLTVEEWLKLANTSTRHEINSFFRSKYRQEIQLETATRIGLLQSEVGHSQSLTSANSSQIEGNSSAEVASLLTQMWKILKTFPLQRKYVYLLGKPEHITNLINLKCVSKKELAGELKMTSGEFDIMIKNLHLGDDWLSQLLSEKLGKPVTVRQIWIWRKKASQRLKREMKSLLQTSASG